MAFQELFFFCTTPKGRLCPVNEKSIKLISWEVGPIQKHRKGRKTTSIPSLLFFRSQNWNNSQILDNISYHHPTHSVTHIHIHTYYSPYIVRHIKLHLYIFLISFEHSNIKRKKKEKYKKKEEKIDIIYK